MVLLLISLIIMTAGGVAALCCGRRAVPATVLGAGSAIAGCLIGLIGTALLLAGSDSSVFTLHWNTAAKWEFALAVDPLSGFFLLLILGVSGLAALYGASYMMAWKGRKNLGSSWFFFNILIASMALVCLARDGLLFLLAWEAMALSSYFLVMFEHERPQVRRAGWTYLVATHIGTALLFVLFVMLAGPGGSFGFETFGRFAAAGGPVGLAFVLAIIGFGTKAGFMPLHVWLPEAHPAAPSHVSAVMSGVMIKTGIYGLLRVMTFLGTPDPWWGWTLIGIGVVSGVLGVLFALAQHDLKRLLAYHSVENIGIIALGLGVGVLGWSLDQPVMAALGFAGGLLHVANHAMFKSLLFLGAGSVQHAAHTLEIDHLGGLAKKMPVTAATFLVGSAAISGLPPLNGFVSEFLIYLGAYKSIFTAADNSIGGLVVIGALAMIGGFAAACFTKAFGAIFLGEPRSEHGRDAHEPSWLIRLPMLLLAAGCVAMGLLGPLLVGAMQPAIGGVTGLGNADIDGSLAAGSAALWYVTAGALLFFALVAALALVRRLLLAGRTVETAGTWDCGYTKPTARMQYTASSFAQPIIRMFRLVVRARRQFTPPDGLLPASSTFSTEARDLFNESMYAPWFARGRAFFSKFLWLQHGRIQVYVLYVVLALLFLLIWKLS